MGKGWGTGDLGPPRTSLNLLFTWEGQSLGLRVAGVQYYPGHFGWESSADYGKGYF